MAFMNFKGLYRTTASICANSSWRDTVWKTRRRRFASVIVSSRMSLPTDRRDRSAERMVRRCSRRCWSSSRSACVKVRVGAQQGLDQGVRSLLCATARRTDKSYDSGVEEQWNENAR